MGHDAMRAAIDAIRKAAARRHTNPTAGDVRGELEGFNDASNVVHGASGDFWFNDGDRAGDRQGTPPAAMLLEPGQTRPRLLADQELLPGGQ